MLEATAAAIPLFTSFIQALTLLSIASLRAPVSIKLIELALLAFADEAICTLKESLSLNSVARAPTVKPIEFSGLDISIE